MKKLIALALLGSTIAVTPAVANQRGVNSDWLEAFCQLYPDRSICRERTAPTR